MASLHSGNNCRFFRTLPHSEESTSSSSFNLLSFTDQHRPPLGYDISLCPVQPVQPAASLLRQCFLCHQTTTSASFGRRGHTSLPTHCSNGFLAMCPPHLHLCFRIFSIMSVTFVRRLISFVSGVVYENNAEY